MPAPSNDPIARRATFGSVAVKDDSAENISGAPLPMATRVTPATLSESLSWPIPRISNVVTITLRGIRKNLKNGKSACIQYITPYITP